MGTTLLKLRIAIVALIAVSLPVAAVARANPLEDPVTITIAPFSRADAIVPKAGAQLSDGDGIGPSATAAVLAPFTLTTKAGEATAEVSVPEISLGEVQWVDDPIGCMDSDPKTKCHPTWGVEYFGQVGGNLPVTVTYTDGGVTYTDYGVVDLVLDVKVVDNRVRSIDGYLQITYSVPTGLPNYRVPVVGRLR